jgi:antitoxin ChpS
MCYFCAIFGYVTINLLENLNMITVHVRKQGGAAVMTIPSDVLKMLHIGIGSTLELDVTNKELIARPAQKKTRKRYSLAELLHGATPKAIKALNKSTEWARYGKPVGREKA